MNCGVSDSIPIPYSEGLNSDLARQIMHVLCADGVWANYEVRTYWHSRRATFAFQ
jgi:hypothetical protein